MLFNLIAIIVYFIIFRKTYHFFEYQIIFLNDKNNKVGNSNNTLSYLSLQSNGVEGLVPLYYSEEQANPSRGAKSVAHLWQKSNAANEAQSTPAPVLLPRHQSVRMTT